MPTRAFRLAVVLIVSLFGATNARSQTAAADVFWVRQAVTGIDGAGGWVYFTAPAERSSVERHLYRVRVDGSGLARLSKEPGTHRISMRGDRHQQEA